MTITHDQLLAQGYVYNQSTRSYEKPEHSSNNSRVGTSQPERSSALADKPAQEIHGVGASQHRPRVTIIMYRCGKPLDADNKWVAPKAICDGLRAAQLIPGDSESEIDYHVEQVRVKTRAEIKTEIMIESAKKPVDKADKVG